MQTATDLAHAKLAGQSQREMLTSGQSDPVPREPQNNGLPGQEVLEEHPPEATSRNYGHLCASTSPSVKWVKLTAPASGGSCWEDWMSEHK